ncbi:MAG: DNRLRE domain-containing protein [Mucilaginibacter sp.]
MKIKILFLAAAIISIFSISACQKANVTPIADKTTDPTKLVTQAVAVVDTSDITITLPQDSLQLTGKSGKPGDVIVGYLWSQISGPNEAVIINESSQSAKAKKLIAGKYLFQFMVINKAGSTGVDTLTVTVKGSNIATLDLSPTNNPYETNITIYNGQDASNHTSIEEPLAAWTIGGLPVTGRNLIKFDLSSIPANATILSANLYMYSDTIPQNGDLIHANYGTDNSFVVQQVAADWDQATVNWFNQPAGITTNQVVLSKTDQPFLNMNIDVKNLVSAMVSNNANYGFKLSLVNEVLYTSRIFCSSYYSDATKHPRLVVKYSRN